MAKTRAEKGEKKLVSRREFLVGGGAVIAAIALASCTAKTTTSTTTATTPTSGTISTLTPKYGGTLRNFGGGEGLPFGWPPATIMTDPAQYCLETLLRGDNKGGVQPWLAESYKLADDFTSITFNLRKGITFHDGSDFNAAVAKWNLDNMIDAGREPNWKSVDLLDDYTIRVNLTQWSCAIPGSFAEGNTMAFMVSKASFDKNGKDWMNFNPIGTGPFKQVMYKLDIGTNVVRNPDYWLKGKPYLDEIDMVSIADYTTRKMLMEAGEVDLAMGQNSVAPVDAAHFRELGWDIEFIMEDSMCLIPDTANPDSPYANQRVREAVEYAIDKEAIAKAFGYGYRIAPYQIPPPASLAYDPNFTGGRKYDLEKAKQLLTEAGYPDGFDTKILMADAGSTSDIAIAVGAILAKAGIRAQVEFHGGSEFITNYVGPAGNWPTGTMLFNNQPRFDKIFLGGIQFIANQVGKSWLRTPEWTQAYNAALAAPAVDIKLIRAVTDIMTRDASYIPVTELGTGTDKKPYVVIEYDQRAFMAFQNWEEVWLDK